ncbi:MAG: hypothetical protein V1774_00920 [Candidatus Eisenbacteria bacterium]
MASIDYAINARVRQVLARHWIHPESLQVGTAEGIVVLKGPLVVEPGGGVNLDDTVHRARLVQRLRSEVEGIPGVRQVVFQLDSGQGVETT